MTIIDYFTMHQFASDTIYMYNNLFTFIIGGQQGTYLYNCYQRWAKYKVIVDRLIGQQNKFRVLRCQTKLETHFSFHSNKMK